MTGICYNVIVDEGNTSPTNNILGGSNMREVTVKVYKFEELSEEVKNKLMNSFRCNEPHDEFMYEDVIESAKYYGDGYEKTGYLMEILKEWSVYDGYGNGYVKFDGNIEVSRFVDEERFLELVKREVLAGNVDTKYLEYGNIVRLLNYLDSYFSFSVYEYRQGYKCDVYYPYSYREGMNKSLDTVCDILSDIISEDVQSITYRLRKDLESVWEYLESDEYISDCLTNYDVEYLEDGRQF